MTRPKTGAVQAEEPFHRARAVLTPEAAFRDPTVEPFLGGPQGAVARGFAQDAVTMVAAVPRAVGLAGV